MHDPLHNMLERMNEQSDWLARLLDDLQGAQPTWRMRLTARVHNVLRSGGAR